MSAPWLRLLPSFVRKRLEGQAVLQGIITNTGWLLADRVVRMGVGLLIGVWIARYLGPEQFGLLSYAGAFVALFSAIGTLGLDGIVVRNVVRHPEFKDQILGAAFLLKLGGTIVALGTTIIAIFLFRPGDSLMHWLVGVMVSGLIFQAFEVIDFWFQSKTRIKFSVIAKNLAFVAISSVKVGLILKGASLIAFAWTGVAEAALSAMGLVIAYRVSGGSISHWRPNVRTALGLLRDSWPLIFSGIVIMIYMRIDQIMIGELVGDAEVGIYSAAVRLAEVWYFIPTAVVSSTFPSIVEALKQDEELFYRRLQKLYNLMAFLGYVVAIPVTFFSGTILKLLFGAAYVEAGPMLALLIWAGLFTNLGVARSSFLASKNWTRIHFVTVFLGCLINVGLNFLLIPLYGGLGAAIATVIAYWFAAHGACFLFRPLFRTGAMLTRALLYPKVW